ncbi:MAG: hypothetical protein R6U22_10360 [Desulfohalobiaceae bacterium]
MEQKTRISAVITAGIYMYLLQEAAQQEEEVSEEPMSFVRLQQETRPAPGPAAEQAEPEPVLRSASPWVLAGRQAVMDRRYQMQFKVFR